MANNTNELGLMASLLGAQGAVAAPTAVTPSDSTVLDPPAGGITACVTAAGDVALLFANGTSMTVPLTAGVTVLPFAPTKIKVTGTTATATYFLNN